MGPILDSMGVEQGGCFSDNIYRLVNNVQLETAQQSELGVSSSLSRINKWSTVPPTTQPISELLQIKFY